MGIYLFTGWLRRKLFEAVSSMASMRVDYIRSLCLTYYYGYWDLSAFGTLARGIIFGGHL